MFTKCKRQYNCRCDELFFVFCWRKVLLKMYALCVFSDACVNVCGCVHARFYKREKEIATRKKVMKWTRNNLCLNILAVDHLMLTGNWNVDLSDTFVYLLFVVLHHVFCMLLTKWHETRFLNCLWRLVSRSDGVYYLWQHLHNGHSSRWLRRMYSLVHVLMYMFTHWIKTHTCFG